MDEKSKQVKGLEICCVVFVHFGLAGWRKLWELAPPTFVSHSFVELLDPAKHVEAFRTLYHYQ
jgi:hypothetical protein